MIEMTSKYLFIAIYFLLGYLVYASFGGHCSALFITPIRGYIQKEKINPFYVRSILIFKPK